jgi:low temperature requirement protein LtrA
MVAGVLVLAAGVPRAFDSQDFGVIVLGYVIIRLALASLWLRAARDDRPRRRTDQRYACGITLCLIAWSLLLVMPLGMRLGGFLVLAIVELLVPLWAERSAPTTWHPHHIAERYGLFTLIVLGESVLSATLAIQQAIDAGHDLGALIEVAVSGLVIVCAMWWLYFAQPVDDVIDRARATFAITASGEAFVWGYGHYVVFGSAAAVGAGIAVAVDEAIGQADLSARAATFAVAVPVVLYMVSVWLLHVRSKPPGLARWVVVPVTAVVVLSCAALGLGLWAIAVVLVCLLLVSSLSVSRRRRAAPSAA